VRPGRPLVATLVLLVLARRPHAAPAPAGDPPAPPAASSAPMSREAAVARARAIRERVSRGETDGLWSDFDERMRAAVQDSASYVTMGRSIHGQIGAIDSVLSEEVNELDSLIVVRTRCRFERLPAPGVLTVSFDPAGRIASLSIRPEAAEPKEYPSPYLDYQPKTRFELPFNGEWLVFWGGRTLGENYHAASRAQRFAHDLVMVRDGRTHPDSSRALTSYYCYGQPILAPAPGVVVIAVDTLPDQPIGSRDTAHPGGNHVVIDHGNHEFSLLAHMQPHSLRVKVGTRVKRGQLLGLAGNSGNTSEPHLHVHLMNGPDMSDADGLPMPFSNYVIDGAVIDRGELRRFQLVRPNRR
jgi:murein DD-endopeptidase MepM/ murein hydrolase activator NlpD